MAMRQCFSSASRSHLRLGLTDGSEPGVCSSPTFEKPSGSHGLPLASGISIEAPA